MKTKVEMLHELYATREYSSLLKDVCQEINLKIEGKHPEILDEFALQDLSNANITPTDLQNILTEHCQNFRQFVLRKSAELEDTSLEQDYPEHEKTDLDDTVRVLKLMHAKIT